MVESAFVNARTLALYLCAALASACSSSTKTDAGVDAGLDSGIDSGIEDGGDGGGGCAQAGYSCDSLTPCCDALDQICDPVQGVCVYSTPDAGDGGPSLPNDGAQWLQEGVSAGVVGLDGLSVPSPALQLAVGTGPSLGQLLQRSPDGGWSVVAGLPAATALYGVWADAAGDVYAVGQQDGGIPLWIAGRLDGGLRAIDLSSLSVDGGAGPLTTLSSVVGLAPGEALAVGAAAFSAPPIALHLLPDGGLATEALPLDVTSAYALTGSGDGGPIYALGSATTSHQLEVLERSGGSWSGEIVFAAGNVSAIAIGPDGEVTVVGDDGNGEGEVFTFVDGGYDNFADGGYFPLPDLPDEPPFTAACETQAGEFYLAASASNRPLQLLHVDGGLASGTWWSETLPADAQTISAIAGDGSGDFFAVGVESCATCAGYPMALRRLP